MIHGAARTVCLLLAAGLMPSVPSASEVVDQNPFAPGRKPWKEEKEIPALPELTPKDLQIDAIISFGRFRGIVAQLDGRLKGTLPANAAGKVRIQVGQNFGGGYVLAHIEPNHVVIQAGSQRFNIPLLRKASKGGPPPAPVAHIQEQGAAPPPPAPVQPAAAPLPAPAPAAANSPIAPSPEQAVAGLPGAESAAAQQPAQPSNGQPAGQPMSLLDAIRRAQEAAKARPGGAAAPAQGTPFSGKP